MKYFKNIKAGVIEAVSDEKVIKMMEKYPEVYQPYDKASSKPAKEAKAPKAEAPKAEK